MVFRRGGAVSALGYASPSRDFNGSHDASRRPGDLFEERTMMKIELVRCGESSYGARGSCEDRVRAR